MTCQSVLVKRGLAPGTLARVGVRTGAERLAWGLSALFSLGGCPSSEEPSTPSGGSDTTAAAASTSSSSGESPDPSSGNVDGSDPVTGAVTTIMPGSSDGGSSTTNAFPPGPGCSVQEVTEGELIDPTDRGDEAGKFPIVIADALEDYCGCHTLENNNQNIKYMFLKAPGGSLFLTYDDLCRNFGGGTLGQAMAEQVTVSHAMPPGSCSFPDEPDELLSAWFDAGMPDGATYDP